MNKEGGSLLFKDKYGPWALVTGATMGIGRAFAESLAARGLPVVLVARGRDRLEVLARNLTARYGVSARCVDMDLSSPRATELLMARVSDLDIGLLVNNAGGSSYGSFLKENIKTLQNITQLNIAVPVELSHALGQRMVARGRGGIVFVGSFVSHVPVPWMAYYAGSKACVLHLGLALASELKPQGIDVITVSPGATDTEGLRSTPGLDIRRLGTGPWMDPRRVSEAALTRLGQSDEVVPGGSLSIVLIRGFMRFLPIRFLSRMFSRVIKRAIAPELL